MPPGTPRHEDIPATAMGFHTTHWTIVFQARDQNESTAQKALETLCTTYWYPLYAFIRRQGAGPHEAEDLTQGFFCHFLEQRAVERVHPAAGKFRSFLLACLKNFLANERERGRAQRRGGGISLIPLEFGEAENRYSIEPPELRTPEVEFERRWAWAVVERAIETLRQQYGGEEKRLLFEQLLAFLPGGSDEPSRADLAAQRGVSVGAIDVAIHRLRQRFGELLRVQVVATVSSPEEVEEEIRYLISVLSA